MNSVQSPSQSTWTTEQNAIITASPSARLFVEAAPGTGKTAVACARVAWLLTETDTTPSKILVVSFTRTAVREIRDRISALSNDSPNVVQIKISTIDSTGWGLRSGFEDATVAALGKDVSFHTSLTRLIALFDARSPGLLDFVRELEHVIVDEGQDVVGARALLLEQFIKALDPKCGVTIFADPAQAIYGFTREDGDRDVNSARALIGPNGVAGFDPCSLNKLFRACTPAVTKLFEHSRACVHGPEASFDPVTVTTTFERFAPKSGTADQPAEDNTDLKDNDDALVLFRYRAEVLKASGNLWNKVEHRLRLSGLPSVVQPWIGWLFGEYVDGTVNRSSFDLLWSQRGVSEHRLSAPTRDQAWNLCSRFAGNARGIDLNVLRRIVARSRPPIEICDVEVGRGPILSTIHASKGREASHVRLFLTKLDQSNDPDEWREEARVLYVGATRAKATLELRHNYKVYSNTLDSGRTYSWAASKKWIGASVEIGIEGDVDATAVMRSTNVSEAQAALAALAGATHSIRAVLTNHGDTWSYVLHTDKHGVVGELSKDLSNDLWTLAKQKTKKVKPASEIKHLSLVGVTTIGVDEAAASDLPAPYSKSRLFLAPVVRGYPLVFFNSHGAAK